MTFNKRKTIILIINTILFLSSAYITCLRVLIGAGAGQLGVGMIGLGYFKAFTNLSNIFNGITALISIIYIIINYKDDKIIHNNWVYKLQYISCISVFLTFITVVFFLTPTQARMGVDVSMFYLHDMFHFHVFNPLLSIFLLIFIYKEYKPSSKDNILAIIPTILYSIVYMIMVLSGSWMDFYGFTFGGKYEIIPIVLIVMYGITFLLGWLIKVVKNRI